MQTTTANTVNHLTSKHSEIQTRYNIITAA